MAQKNDRPHYDQTCHCNAYRFPHRVGGGACQRRTPYPTGGFGWDTDPDEEYLAELDETDQPTVGDDNPGLGGGRW
jgi:hypothetical protein